jgi:CDGSH-type Zn-finger protein
MQVNPLDQVGRAPTVEIEVRHNGPYRIRGPIRLLDAAGNEYDLSDVGLPGGGPPTLGFVSLCRCGGSSRKPFCDGTHKRNGFEAPERARD